MAAESLARDGLRVRNVEGIYAANFLYDPFGRLRAGGVRLYAKCDANWNMGVRFMMEGNSYYDPLTATQVSSTWYYPLYDSLGSTRWLINASQTVTDSYSYDAFGNITSQSGSTYNPYKYVGSLGYCSGDGNTGLQHLGARYYNPTTGRFTTRDPISRGAPGPLGPGNIRPKRGLPGDPYGYCNNDPLDRVDPSGLQGGEDIGVIAAAIIVACATLSVLRVSDTNRGAN